VSTTTCLLAGSASIVEAMSVMVVHPALRANVPNASQVFAPPINVMMVS
jgi:hypothetical protein